MLKSGKSLRRAIEAGIDILRAEDGEVSVANLGTLMSERFSEVIAAHGELLQQAGFRAYCRGVIKHARRKEGLSAAVIQTAFSFNAELPEFVAIREKKSAAFPWIHLSDCTVAHLDQNLAILDKQAICSCCWAWLARFASWPIGVRREALGAARRDLAGCSRPLWLCGGAGDGPSLRGAGAAGGRCGGRAWRGLWRAVGDIGGGGGRERCTKRM